MKNIKSLNYFVFLSIFLTRVYFLNAYGELNPLLEVIKTSGEALKKQDLSKELSQDIKEQFKSVSDRLERYVLENAESNDKILFVYTAVKNAKDQLVATREALSQTLKKIESGIKQDPLELLLSLQGMAKSMNSILKVKETSLQKSPTQPLSAKNKNALSIIMAMADAIKSAALNLYTGYHNSLSRSLKKANTPKS